MSLFGAKAKLMLSDIMNPKSLKKVINRYNQIFCDDVIADKIQTMEREITDLLFDALLVTNKLAVTIAIELYASIIFTPAALKRRRRL